MSALDVSDPHISMAYDALAQNDPLRWFLLAYGNKATQLSLCASGTGDLDELRAHITPGNVHYGVFREPNHDSIFCISLAVIPDSVGGVRRARAHAHARAIPTIFKTQEVLNVSSPEQITIEALRSVLRLPPRGTPMTLSPVSVQRTDIDSTMTHRSHVDSAVTSVSRLTPTSALSHPPSSLDPPPSGLSPPSSGSSVPTPTPSNSKSHRKPPPRLSMPPAAKGPQSTRAVPSSRTHLEHSPTLIHAKIPSPRSSAASSPLGRPPGSPNSHHPVVSSPHTPITDIVSPGDLSAQASWLAKQEAPLPPPPPATAAPPDPEPEPEERPRESWRAEFQPKSAFESDGDESSEVDYGVRMHGPLTDIAGMSSTPPAPTPAPSSPIGSIPSEPSACSKSSSVREPSPASKPSSAALPVATNGAHNDASSSSQTPAQEEAARARGAWTAQTQPADDAKDTGSPPPPPPSKPSPIAKYNPKEQTMRSLGRGVAPPQRETDAKLPAARRARAATETLNSLTPTPSRDVHRRMASQDMPNSPPASRSRFLERASPETMEEERRLAMLDEERRRRATERVQREREERAEEEARERAFTERKERERARRIELAKQAEARRAEERRREEEIRAEREAKEAREREAKEAKDREVRAKAQQRIERSSSGMELLSGFVTLEMASVWRRRYFKLSTDSWQFFRSDKDVAQPVHVIELSRVRALREWNEGYEELEAIPHSFAVEFTDDGPCQCFADSAEDKEILLGLLNQAAGL